MNDDAATAANARNEEEETRNLWNAVVRGNLPEVIRLLQQDPRRLEARYHSEDFAYFHYHATPLMFSVYGKTSTFT